MKNCEKCNKENCECKGSECKHKDRHRQRSWVGLWLILLGLYFLLRNYGVFSTPHLDIPFEKLWPIFIIIPGIMMLIRNISNK